MHESKGKLKTSNSYLVNCARVLHRLLCENEVIVSVYQGDNPYRILGEYSSHKRKVSPSFVMGRAKTR